MGPDYMAMALRWTGWMLRPSTFTCRRDVYFQMGGSKTKELPSRLEASFALLVTSNGCA